MEEYIKPLQEYLNENYSDNFIVDVGDRYFELAVIRKNIGKVVMVINEFEYDEEDFEINLFEKFHINLLKEL